MLDDDEAKNTLSLNMEVINWALLRCTQVFFVVVVKRLLEMLPRKLKLEVRTTAILLGDVNPRKWKQMYFSRRCMNIL